MKKVRRKGRRRIKRIRRTKYSGSYGIKRNVYWRNDYWGVIQSSIDNSAGKSVVTAKGWALGPGMLWTDEGKGLDRYEKFYRGFKINKVVYYVTISNTSRTFSTDDTAKHIIHQENDIMSYVFKTCWSKPAEDYVLTSEYWRKNNLGGIKYLKANKVARHRITWYLKPRQYYWPKDSKFTGHDFSNLMIGQDSDERTIISKYVLMGPMLVGTISEKSTYYEDMDVNIKAYYYMSFAGRRFVTPNVTYINAKGVKVGYDDDVNVSNVSTDYVNK